MSDSVFVDLSVSLRRCVKMLSPVTSSPLSSISKQGHKASRAWEEVLHSITKKLAALPKKDRLAPLGGNHAKRMPLVRISVPFRVPWAVVVPRLRCVCCVGEVIETRGSSKITPVASLEGERLFTILG